MGLPATIGQIEDIQRLHSGERVTVDQVDDEQKYPLGTLAFGEGDKVYRYVEMIFQASESPAKSPVGFRTPGQWQVTGDESAQIGNTAAGVLMTAASTGDFVWIQVAGFVDGLRKEAGAIAQGDIILISDGTDNAVEDHGTLSHAELRRMMGIALSSAANADTTIDNVLLKWLL